MKNIYHTLGLLIFVVSFIGNIEAAHHEDALLDAVNNSDRNSKYSARDDSRNPYETLSFFQIKPTMHVLELSAGGGWYTEILAPYLQPAGKLSVTHHNPEAGGYYKRSRNSYDEKVKSNPLFMGVEVITADVPPTKPFTKPATQDLVVTFRNLHTFFSNSWVCLPFEDNQVLFRTSLTYFFSILDKDGELIKYFIWLIVFIVEINIF